jgi:hypothetical protein
MSKGTVLFCIGTYPFRTPKLTNNITSANLQVVSPMMRVGTGLIGKFAKTFDPFDAGLGLVIDQLRTMKRC